MTLEFALEQVHDEVVRATRKFEPFNSAHEGFAVLKEEVDELWDEVKANNSARQKAEAIQVAAMAVRFLMDQRTDAALKAGFGAVTEVAGTPK